MFNKILRRVLPALLAALISAAAFAVPAGASEPAEAPAIFIGMNIDGLENPPDITADAAIILNTGTGEILYSKNADKIIYPASTVKIMTAVIVLENVSDLSAQVEISRNASNAPPIRIDPGVSTGEIFTVEQLLYAMLLRGANDATVALAEHVSGSVAEFLIKMNERARELGCENTHFTNPTGLHSPDMRTTVYDTAKIALHASKLNKIIEITSSLAYTIPATNMAGQRILENRNQLISRGQTTRYFYEHARGINFGSTAEAGFSLTTVAELMGISYLCVVMGSTSTEIAGGGTRFNCYDDARALLDWSFSLYSFRTVISASTSVFSADVGLSAGSDSIALVPETDIIVLLPQNVDMDREISFITDIPGDLVAPIERWQRIGTVTVLYNGEIVGTANLLAGADVDPSNILYALDRIKNIVSGTWFKASVIIFIAVSGVYLTVKFIRRDKRERF